MSAWGLVPARGGSKSIPGKNLVHVAGRPLIEYGVRAALASGRLDRIVCSTEDEAIASAATSLGIEVDRRPDDLCGDETPVADVAREFLGRQAVTPEMLALIQPTSPFLRIEDVQQLIDAMVADPGARSGQTICACPHNHHAWNQRELDADGRRVAFRFAEERSAAYNKQKKPKLFVFGNLVVTRSRALLDGDDFFATPSLAVEIPRPYDFDLDTQEDRVLAEALLESGSVVLAHMS